MANNTAVHSWLPSTPVANVLLKRIIALGGLPSLQPRCKERWNCLLSSRSC